MKVEQTYQIAFGEVTVRLQTSNDGHTKIAHVSEQQIMRAFLDAIQGLELELTTLSQQNPRGYTE